MTSGSPSQPQYVYRGVHAKHPMLKAALKGTVVPGDPTSDLTAAEHNVLNESMISPFTSWTYFLPVARGFANSRGPGGVILRFEVEEDPELMFAQSSEQTWRWEASPDAFHELEVLLRGVRIGAEVMSDD